MSEDDYRETLRKIRNIRKGTRYQTNAERYAAHIARRGTIHQCKVTIRPVHRAGLNYLRKQWGFKGDAETFRACLSAIVVMTRLGLQTLPTELPLDD